MERARRKPLLLLCAVFIMICYISPIYKTFNGVPLINISVNWSISSLCENGDCLQSIADMWESSDPMYLVFTNSCKIMDMDPFDKSVKKFLKKSKPMKCKSNLVRVDGQTLRIDDAVSKHWKNDNPTCCYRTLKRVTQNTKKYNKHADWEVTASTKCYPIPIGKGTKVDDEFLRVECKNGLNVKSGPQFETVVLPPHKQSNKTAAKVEIWDNEPGKIVPPSILIIGIDSISRLHMLRSLPDTKKFLDGNDFIEMKGYTKIGENTFPNVMGFLGGMGLNKYPCFPSKSAKIDDCPFIWNNFSSAGYVTAHLEDSPGIAIFNYEKTGFVEQPTDYYLRPIMIADHLHHKRAKNGGGVSCMGGKSPTDFMLNYINELTTHFGSKYPYFLLSWFTSIGHDDFNGLKLSDAGFRDLLKDAVNKPGGNNTVILFISDHGYRFGAFRETFLGFYEESLPFFFIRFPPSLKEYFPDWYENLKRNSHRLTTPLDLHQTFTDILRLNAPIANISSNDTTDSSKTSDENYTEAVITTNSQIEQYFSQIEESGVFARNATFRDRYSFFEVSPRNRTCESSGIPQTYCMCGVTPELGRKADKSKELSEFVLSELNTNTLKSSIKTGLCVKLSFNKVLYGRELSKGEEWNNFGKLVSFNEYLVAFEALPSKAHFEAKVRIYQDGSHALPGPVSRINSYKGQSDCVDDYALKNYCMCKKT